MKRTKKTIALLGDVALNGLFNKEPENNKRRFKEVTGLLQAAGQVFANLETPAWGDGAYNENKQNQKGVLLYTQQEVLREVLPLLNITAVSLANNHVYDCHKQGLLYTIRCLESLKIGFTGAGFKQKHLEPVVMTKNGCITGFAAYVHPSTRPMVSKESGVLVNYFDEDKIIAGIKQLKKTCHCVILSLHWGVDYSFYPTRYQREVSKRFIDAGADIIMGHHPHTVQPYEIYNGGFIFYSLGSFCFGDFMYKGKLRSLKRKTKKTILPIIAINGEPRMTKCHSLRELPGNRLVLSKHSLQSFLRTKRSLMKLKHRFKIVNFIIKVKEVFFDRIIEYFFGYYRNPLAQLISFGSNLKKIKDGFRDYKQRKTGAYKKFR
ncbi:MAG: CapA family protein [bacterium]|nr:CapA family protein [bacterium]